MAERAVPRPPKGLAAAGQALWSEILDDLAPDLEFDARELHLLGRACRCADELSALEAAVDRDGITVTGSRGQTIAHPALSEARQLRLVQLRLLGSVEMADPATGRAGTLAQARAKRAADSRWTRKRAEHG